jgi:UDP-2-acetamido-2,6-beta-L-arabino-hexul-4-ose reductase
MTILKMIKIGITGQSGFVGTHIYNYLGLQTEVERIPFSDGFFQNESKLLEFVKSCDVIVHLAAMNRHNNPDVIYNTNIELVNQLISACESVDVTPHIIFSSSTQETRDSPYGRSKLDGRNLFEGWALKNEAIFTGLIIPNVFGPYGEPHHNSFIATFCYQLTHGEYPTVDMDAEVRLIYVAELVDLIWKIILAKSVNSNHHTGYFDLVEAPFTTLEKVSHILDLLRGFKCCYFEKGIIPNLDNEFEKNLFNTFLCYIDHKSFFPFYLSKHSDERGSFVETMKLQSGGQISFSITVPGITRGNHYHTRKAERFAVIKGKAKIQLRKMGTDEVLSFELYGEIPSFIDMPIWFTHSITNIGEDDLYTIFWINEHYDADDSDTHYEKV